MFSTIELNIDPNKFLTDVLFFLQQNHISFHILEISLYSDLRKTRRLEHTYQVHQADGRIEIKFHRPVLCRIARISFATNGLIVGEKLSYLKPLSRESIIQALKRKKIAFSICAKDCANELRVTLARLFELGKFFSDFRVFLAENDSQDGTKELLLSLGSYLADRLKVSSFDGIGDLIPSRTARLSSLRNALQREILKSDYEPDYLMIVDADGLIDSVFSLDGVFSCFEYEQAWDGVFPVGDTHYYDIYALRHNDLGSDDYINKIFSMDNVLPMEYRSFLAATIRTLPLKNLDGWLKVDSAFGGIGLYKWQTVKDCVYSGLNDGTEICEHVPYNRSICSSGGFLYINPRLVIKSPESSAITSLLVQYYSSLK